MQENPQSVLFCPVASLFSLSFSGPCDEDSKMLSGCFRFSSEVDPGWIQYNPDKITVITSNDMFKPLGKPRDIVQPKKQMIKIVTQDDISTLEDTLEKPVLLCVTRRQHFAPVDVSLPDSKIRNRCTVSGFDIDFAVIFPPALLKQKLKRTLELTRINLAKKRKFCFMVDFRQVLEELTPQELQDSCSLEYVSWHNTAFWLTNHSKPHHSLMYINNVLFWTALFPYAFFVALPYRAGRRFLCKDERLALRNPMKFKAGQVDERVVVCLWSNEAPPPGAYSKHIDRFSITAAHLNWLRPFLRDSNMITFDFAEEDGNFIYWIFWITELPWGFCKRRGQFLTETSFPE